MSSISLRMLETLPSFSQSQSPSSSDHSLSRSESPASSPSQSDSCDAGSETSGLSKRGMGEETSVKGEEKDLQGVFLTQVGLAFSSGGPRNEASGTMTL